MASTPVHVAHPPLQGSARMWGTLALSSATFMNVLDTSIANVSLPAIAGDLGVSPNQGTWVITSFAIANAIALPMTGWLSQRIGQVRLFVTSVLLFVLASWLCGLAPNMSTLIAFRALQGFVAGPMIPLSQSLLLASYPPVMAGVAMATWSMTTLIAPIFGPLVGGWITDNIAWSWIFYINIPVGLLSAVACWTLYRKRESQVRILPIDVVGLVMLVVWIGSLQLVLDIGKEHDWFHSATVTTFAVVAGVVLVFFIIWELTDDHPVVELNLFRNRNFTVGTLAMSIGYALFFGNMVLVPLWLQQYMGYTATQAGMVVAPVGLLAMVVAPFVGRNLHRVDPRYFATFAYLVIGLTMWMRSHFTIEADMATIIIPTIIQGLGSSMFFIALVTITLSGIPPERIPAATGLTNFARITAGALGASVSTTLWESRAALHHAQLSESIHQGSLATQATLGGLQAGGLSAEQSLALINHMIDQQAFMMAANDIFLMSSVGFVGLIPLLWLTRPRRGAASAAEAAAAH
ncbi:MAG: DHA2 family efflux MFS transporter permease subunit [Burkholderiaceae bacterium]|nr:DHA2 family efflux MFS transporter permease subunit [Burkholderiaceae bacterium]